MLDLGRLMWSFGSFGRILMESQLFSRCQITQSRASTLNHDVEHYSADLRRCDTKFPKASRPRLHILPPISSSLSFPVKFLWLVPPSSPPSLFLNPARNYPGLVAAARVQSLLDPQRRLIVQNYRGRICLTVVNTHCELSICCSCERGARRLFCWSVRCKYLPTDIA
jgi:hypothetical protein